MPVIRKYFFVIMTDSHFYLFCEERRRRPDEFGFDLSVNLLGFSCVHRRDATDESLSATIGMAQIQAATKIRQSLESRWIQEEAYILVVLQQFPRARLRAFCQDSPFAAVRRRR